MNPTRLILVRHGQAHCNVSGIVGGPRSCTGLTDLGRHQANLLAQRLLASHTATPITAAYASPLPRTRQTADIIASTLGLPVDVDTDLREPDYGHADGQPWTRVVADYGAIPALHPHDPIAPEAEAWTDYLHRARETLTALLEQHSGTTVLVIAHGETVTAAAHLFLNLPVQTRAFAAFAVHYASITTWEQQPLAWTQPESGWRWTLLQHNDTAHLGTA